MPISRSLAAILASCLVTAACGGKAAPAPEAAQTTADATSGNGTAAAADARPTACVLVTPSEMSRILGVPVKGEADEHTSDQSICSYAPLTGVSPTVEVKVNWGDGDVAMSAAGAMNGVEKGITSPYAGIGDQAFAVGTTLMIRNGKDLITFTFSGLDDLPAVSRKIFDVAKPRL